MVLPRITSAGRWSDPVTWMRYLAALLPILWIFSRMDPVRFMPTLSSTAWWLLPAVTVLILTVMVLQGVRWWVLLKAFLPDLSLPEAMSAHFSSLFYSIILPTSAAQDVLKSVLLSRRHDYAFVWGATWLSRLMGLLVLTFYSVCGLFFLNQGPTTGSFLPWILLFSTILLLLLLLSFSKRFTRPLGRIADSILPERVSSVIKGIREGIYRFRTKGKESLQVFLLSLIMHTLLVLNAFLIIKGITGEDYLVECFAFIPMIEVLSIMLPLTPNSLGIREGLTAILFDYLGLSPEALGVCVMVGFYGLSLRLLGGIWVLRNLRDCPEKESAYQEEVL